ncbi:DUF6178 family protein [Desulfonema ishimotonii]|nr:DUF6178 family protein [Desulfonema ishimotonii]
MRLRELADRRREILSLPPEKALARIINERQPLPLVHSFPEEDFYFLIHDIGLGDSIELLGMASDRQWEYLFDAEIWHRDHVLLPAVTRWMSLLMKADPDRLIRWAAHGKVDLTEYYLFRNIEVAVREHDQDPADLGDGFVTEDDVFYVRFRDLPPRPDSDSGDGEDRETFLSGFLKRLSDYDHIRYQQILLESASIIPAEAEEELYRLRNVRRAEKGFQPAEEAVGIYQPILPDALRHMPRKVIAFPEPDAVRLPVPLYPASVLEGDNLFTRALATIDGAGILGQLQTEFAGLCNQILSADQQVIRDRGELRQVVRKACGYMSIGLDALTDGATEEKTTGRAASLIKNYPLFQIFRTGYGQALELKWRAERWFRESWLRSRELPLSFWGEEWLGVLGGLLIKKPLFFDNYETGKIYREFESVADIRRTAAVLDEIVAADTLFGLTDLPTQAPTDRMVIWQNWLLTLWAREQIGLEPGVFSIPLNRFRPFFRDLWTGEGSHRTIRDTVRTDFLNWLSHKTGLPDHEVSLRLGNRLEALFRAVESEYGPVADKDLDPRYVPHFLLA